MCPFLTWWYFIIYLKLVNDMRKELRTYDTIGVSDYDEYSYCEKNQMCYENGYDINMTLKGVENKWKNK